MFNNMKVAMRLAILAGTLVALMIVIGVLGIQGMRQAKNGMETVFKDRVVPMRDLKAVVDNLAITLTDIPNKATKQQISFGNAQKESKERLDKIEGLWHAYLNTVLVDDETALISEINPLWPRAEDRAKDLDTWYSNKNTTAINAYMERGW
jgi:methyl-accepting chemotaxis protein